MGSQGDCSSRVLYFGFVFHRVLTVKTLLGRKARPKILSQGGPLIRVKPDDLRAAGPIFLSLGANS